MCFQRQESEHRISGDGSSSWPIGNSWPTPDACARTGVNQGGAKREGPQRPTLAELGRRWPTATATDGKGSSRPGQRRGQLDDALHRWATPTAGDAKASGSRNAPGSAAHAGTRLTDMIRTGDSHGRRDRETPKDGENGSKPAVLNPRFVEALMGMPLGWTDCAASVTESYRSWLRAHGWNSPAASLETDSPHPEEPR